MSGNSEEAKVSLNKITEQFKADMRDSILRNHMTDVILQAYALMLGGAVVLYDKEICDEKVISNQDNFILMDNLSTDDWIITTYELVDNITIEALYSTPELVIKQVHEQWRDLIDSLKNGVHADGAFKMIGGTARFSLIPVDLGEYALSVLFAYAPIEKVKHGRKKEENKDQGTW